MLLALGQGEIPRPQGIFDRQGQAGLPRIAVNLACLISECPSQLFGHEGDRGIIRDLFECASIQLPNDVKSVYQTVITLLSGKG